MYAIKTQDPNTDREITITTGYHTGKPVMALFPNLPENSDTNTPVLIPTLAIISALKESFTQEQYTHLWDLETAVNND